MTDDDDCEDDDDEDDDSFIDILPGFVKRKKE